MLDRIFMKQGMEFLVRAGLILLLVIWCYEIIKPFIIPLLWGAIIAVALFPMHRQLSGWLGQREHLSAGLMSLLLLVLLIVPMVLLTASSVDMVRFIAEHLQSGEINITSIRESIASLPWIGDWLQQFIVPGDLQVMLKNLSPLLKTVGKQMLAFSAGVGSILLYSLIAIVVAGFLLLKADISRQWFLQLARKLADEQGEQLAQLAGATVMSVAQGVLGVALIQAFLAGIGMLLAGVPGTGLWALLVLVVATIQLPPLLVLAPVAIYLFAVGDTTAAVVFLGWSIFISLIDTLLRPLLMGRGVKTPMLVIMLGAIGGMLSFGVVGLFVGSVVLAVGYEVLHSWLQLEQLKESSENETVISPVESGESNQG
ncbi:MAG: AI-2E family transporter [Chromatiales bacterium]|jgi:predicted PurR-regulated permease PerM